MDSQAPRQRPDSRIALFAGVLLAALSGCYPYGRMPGYPGPYPYGPQQSHAELLSQGAHQPRLERHEPWEVASEEAVPTHDGGDIVCNWKERMAQPYVYLEHQGDYRGVHDVIRRILQLGVGMQVSGPPFVLYFNDPARTPANELVSRVCLPVLNRPGDLPEPMNYEVLPRAMVVYAEVPGSYDKAGRSYGALFKYMSGLGWEKSGPLREIYLVNPATATSPEDLLAEVQVPVQIH